MSHRKLHEIITIHNVHFLIALLKIKIGGEKIAYSYYKQLNLNLIISKVNCACVPLQKNASFLHVDDELCVFNSSGTIM